MQKSKPSQTAAIILKGLLYLDETKVISGLLDPKAKAVYQECLRELSPVWLKLIPYKAYQIVFGLMEKLTIPGLFIHHFFRKKIIERWLMKAIDKNYEQVVIFAAGFDALVSVYYAKYPHIKFIEIDHPATQKVKRAVFERLNGTPENVQFVECDLSEQSLMSILTETAVVDPSLKTYFVAEGITMYFPQHFLENFFKDIRLYFNEVLLAFTFMEKQPNSSIQFKQATFIVDQWLKMQNEIFQWGIEADKLQPQFLEPLKFQQLKLLTTAKEKAHYGKAFEKQNIADGELVCLARKSDIQ
jgi:methyltransferase (TIGR00027 family)